MSPVLYSGIRGLKFLTRPLNANDLNVKGDAMTTSRGNRVIKIGLAKSWILGTTNFEKLLNFKIFKCGVASDGLAQRQL